MKKLLIKISIFVAIGILSRLYINVNANTYYIDNQGNIVYYKDDSIEIIDNKRFSSEGYNYTPISDTLIDIDKPNIYIKPVKTIYDKILFIGDSRVVGMTLVNSLLKDNIDYICKSGSGLQFIKNNDKNIINRSGNNIFFCSGVNDMTLVDQYIDYYKSLPKNFYEENNVYILSLNPLDEIKSKRNGYTITNEMIEAYNKKIKVIIEELGIKYIDCYNYLIDTGFGTTDGIHYDSDTYIKIYNYCFENL